ncbi:MAG: tRNA ((37)-N6)-dimethylallyltransferase MiaA [Bacteroidota bacterium]
MVAGPTAVGKTAAAIALAKQYNTSIVSADSRQCFKELKIGVARPTETELAEVKHYFIANHSIHESITAGSFAREAKQYLEEIFKTNDTAIVCGGTGLYIKALVEGLDEIPAVPSTIREQVIQLYEKEGIDALRNRLLSLDPEFEKQGDTNNPNRMMRALEVVLHTRTPIHQFQINAENRGIDNLYNIVYKVVDLPRATLYDRINARVDQMMREGLEAEAKSVYPFKELTALQTVGYKELFDFFDGLCSREYAIEKIKQHTRNYAKRQITWFKRYAQ